ncbi:nucleotidyltransferase family protein [Candidatus Woesebacteria bacterium]|nr:nucleotidyltransferase family protein [Candidatus Woesebacteria bacterium]
MVMNTSGILELIDARKSDISKLGIVKVGLFGSFSRGEQNKESDIDLLVEFDKNKKNYQNYMNFVKLAENLFGRKVEVVTPESLSPYIAPYIKKEVKYVKIV